MAKKAWWVIDSALGKFGPYKTKKEAKKEGLGLWGPLKRLFAGVYYDPEDVQNVVYYGRKTDTPFDWGKN